MSSLSDSTNDQPNNRSRNHCCGWGKGGNWSAMNIAAMVLGFILFWPIGLFILFWIITGRNVRDLADGVRHQWSKMTQNWNSHDSLGKEDRNGNMVFNEFQQTQYDRIREIKDEIKERARRFGDYRADAKRRADKEEFNRFMSDVPGSADN